MRLIDGEELMRKVYAIRYLRKLKARMLIDECKEVKAIPIEWMAKWVRNDRTADPDTFIDMLTDWEKENERND